MRRLNFFLDIDGTLLPFGKGVPESAKRAIRHASSLGHRFFLSTGRSLPEVDPELKALPFSGGVYSAGGVVVLDDKVISRRVFSKEEKDFMLDYAEEEGLALLIQSEDGTYLSKESGELFTSLLKKHIGRVLDIPNFKLVDSFPENLDIYKLLFISVEGKVDKVRQDLKEQFVVVDNTVGLPHQIMAEIVLPSITKATGIQMMLDALSEQRESVVAIGDGANDIEMIEFAALGIAMGNSDECLRRCASFVTDDVERDGLEKAIEYALEHLS